MNAATKPKPMAMTEAELIATLRGFIGAPLTAIPQSPTETRLELRSHTSVLLLSFRIVANEGDTWSLEGVLPVEPMIKPDGTMEDRCEFYRHHPLENFLGQPQPASA